MVFPIEAEHRAKRRALRLCQDHLRKVLEVYRKTLFLIENFVEGEKSLMKDLYEEIQNLGDEVDDSKRKVAQDLVEIGAILISREDFQRFTDVTSEIADFCKGVGFRIEQICEKEMDIPFNLKKNLLNLAEGVFGIIGNLRETFLMLNYGSPMVLEKAREVQISERKVDDIYRDLEIAILESNLNIKALLLLRDVVQLFEETADKIEDASDIACLLAFAI